VDEVEAFIQKTIRMGDHLRGVARHEEAFELGIAQSQLSGQIPAAHLGHHHVGHQQLNGIPKFLSQQDGFARCVSRQDFVAQAQEHALAHPQDGWFIFDQEDGFVAESGGFFRVFILLRDGLLRVPGEVDLEG
jgi:hypothetical protein